MILCQLIIIIIIIHIGCKLDCQKQNKGNRPTAEKLPDGIGLFGFGLFWVISAKFIQRDTQGIRYFYCIGYQTIPSFFDFLQRTSRDASKFHKLWNTQMLFCTNFTTSHTVTSENHFQSTHCAENQSCNQNQKNCTLQGKFELIFHKL